MDVTATVVFKKKNGRPTPEYSVEIDGSETGRVRFCIPQKILKTPGDAMLQLKLYGDDSLLNSVIVPFEVIPSITDCGHADCCKPVTPTILQKVEAALEDLDMMREEFEAAEAERNDQFEAWEETLSNAGSKAVVNKPTRYDFPSVGDANVIYKAESERKLYQWNDTE